MFSPCTVIPKTKNILLCSGSIYQLYVTHKKLISLYSLRMFQSEPVWPRKFPAEYKKKRSNRSSGFEKKTEIINGFIKTLQKSTD